MSQLESAIPKEDEFLVWVKDKQTKTNSNGTKLYFQYGAWRSEQGWKNHWKQHRKQMNEAGHPARVRLRLQAIQLLGGKCVRCGFDDIRALQFDHINGGGYQDKLFRGSVNSYYKHVLEVNHKKFQLLCANCNIIKRHENNEFRKPRFTS